MQPVLDVAAAEWIRPRLTGRFGAVSRASPSGYEAYARVLHPVEDDTGRRFSWSQVAALTGGQVHPSVQWAALIGSQEVSDPRIARWSGSNPAVGELAPDILTVLCSVLVRYTQTAQDCRFALWDGYGWIHGGSAVSLFTASNPAVDPSPPPAHGHSSTPCSRRQASKPSPCTPTTHSPTTPTPSTPSHRLAPLTDHPTCSVADP